VTRWIINVFVGLAAIVGAAALIGMALPVGHRAQRSVIVPRPPSDVFGAITDFARHPEWRADVRRVSVDGAGTGAIVREESGSDTLTFRVEVFEPPTRLVMRIVDDSLPFGGVWTYELRPTSAGTELTIIEDGEVYNPIFRFVSRFVIGHHATIDRYLSDLTMRRW
jgi:hypothetical protein